MKIMSLIKEFHEPFWINSIVSMNVSLFDSSIIQKISSENGILLEDYEPNGLHLFCVSWRFISILSCFLTALILLDVGKFPLHYFLRGKIT